MKKTITIFVAALMCFLCSTPAFAAEQDIKKIHDSLKPFIEVMDRISQEIGFGIIIPPEEEVNVFNYYKGYTLQEFEISLREEVNQFINYYSQRNKDFPVSSINNSSSIHGDRSIEMDIVQDCPIRYNSTLYLYSTVFGIGNPVHYRYESINGINITWPSNYTGFHYSLSSWNYELLNNDKTCKVNLHGVPKNAAGIVLTIVLDDTVNFYLN